MKNLLKAVLLAVDIALVLRSKRRKKDNKR